MVAVPGARPVIRPWLLEQVKLRFPRPRVQVLRPIADQNAPTVTELHGRVQALAEAMGL